MKKTLHILLILVTVLNLQSQNYNWHWAKNIKNAKFKRSIKVNNQGDVYVTGVYSGTLGVESSTLASNGGDDIFIAKYSNSGNLIWVKNLGGAGNDLIDIVEIDQFNNLLIDVQFTSDVFSVGSSTIANPINNNSNCMLLKLDGDGNYLWHAPIYGNNIESITDFQILTNNDIIITGISSSTTFSIANTNYSKTYTNNAVYVAKFSQGGSLLWSKLIESSNANSFESNFINVDSQNNIYLTGYADKYSITPIAIGTNTIQNNLSSSNYFMIKYNSSGNFIWLKKINTSGVMAIRDIKIDNTDKIVIAGEIIYSSPLVLGTNTITNQGDFDALLAKCDTVLNFLWVKQFGGTLVNPYERYVALNTDNFGNIVAGATIVGTSSVTFSSVTYTNTATSTIYLNTYDSNGNEKELMKIGDTGGNSVMDFTIDNNGYYYLLGSISNSTFTLGNNVVDFNNGTNFFTKFSPVTLGNKAYTETNDFHIIPIPSNGEFTVKSERHNSRIMIYDTFGKIILTTKLELESKLDLKYLTSGIYFYTLLTEDNLKKNGKLIILK